MSRHIILWWVLPPSMVARQINRCLSFVVCFARARVHLTWSLSSLCSDALFHFFCACLQGIRSWLCSIWDFSLWVIMCKVSSHLSLEENFGSEAVLSIHLQMVEGGQELFFLRRVRQHPQVPRNRSELLQIIFLLSVAECWNSSWKLAVGC